MKTKPTPKPETPITVAQTIRLTVKGVNIELTTDEAKSLHMALGAIVAPPVQESKLDRIARDVERIKNTPIPSPITIPYPVPQWPRDERPYRPRWNEIWCSTDHTMAVSVAHEGPR